MLNHNQMVFEFTGEIWEWRGPAPFFFITIPQDYSQDIKSISSLVTYGWGVIPVKARIGNTEFKTSLFPKDDKYLLPVKAAVRKAEGIATGDMVSVRLEVRL
jgi:hypothetical protein